MIQRDICARIDRETLFPYVYLHKLEVFADIFRMCYSRSYFAVEFKQIIILLFCLFGWFSILSAGLVKRKVPFQHLPKNKSQLEVSQRKYSALLI